MPMILSIDIIAFQYKTEICRVNFLFGFFGGFFFLMMANRHSGCQVHVHMGNVVASSIPNCRSRASHRELRVFLHLRSLQAIVSARIATPTNHRYPFFSASSVRVMQHQWMHPRLRVTSLILDLPLARFALTRLLSIILRSRTSQHTLPLPAMR